MKPVDEKCGCVWMRMDTNCGCNYKTKLRYGFLSDELGLDYVRVLAIAPRSQNKTRCNVEKWCMQNQILQKRWGKQMCMDEMCGCNYKTYATTDGCFL